MSPDQDEWLNTAPFFREEQRDPTHIVSRHIPNLFDSRFGHYRWGKP
jgi:hypothetical protein